MIRSLDGSANYYTQKGASWLGPKVEVLTNGWNYFYNKNNDTLKINTLASVDDDWISYKYQSGSYIKAVVDAIVIENFLGLEDSVKTISFHAFDINDNPETNVINNLELKISKNYGFVKLLNIYEFPFEDNSDYSIYQSPREPMFLIGMSSPLVGWQNTTNYNYFDFEVGQEMHTREYSEASLWSNMIENLSINQILEKNISNDSVSYIIARCFSRYSKNFGNVLMDSTSGNDTISVHYPLHSVFDKLSLEYNGSDSYIEKTMKTCANSWNLFDSIGIDTLGYIIADGLTSYSYILNAGEYYSNQGFMAGESGLDLLYYHDSMKYYGSPLFCNQLLTVSEDINRNNIQILNYPNEHKIYVASDEKVMVSAYNILGDLFERVEIEGYGDVVLPNSGVYIIKCKSKSGCYVKKIICN